MCYAQQQQAITRMIGMLEDEATTKKNNMMKEMQMENKRMAQQKRDREDAWKNEQAESNNFEVTLTNHNEELLPDGKTTRHF